MVLNVTDPAILFPGISLLFLAYTNRYLALASIVRQLNNALIDDYDENREKQIENLLFRIKLIRLMQLHGVLAFICCIVSMSSMMLGHQTAGLYAFGGSMIFMMFSLCIAFTEIARSGDGLRLEIERSRLARKDASKA